MALPNGGRSKMRFAEIGPLVIEFYQPVEGETMHKTFLKNTVREFNASLLQSKI